MKYIIKGAGLSVIGKVRTNNEDNLCFDKKNLAEKNDGSKYIYELKFNNFDNKVFAVFDGMGGESRGERASYIASTILKEFVKEKDNQEIEWNEFVDIANQSICTEMYGKDRMGTTMAGIQFCESYINISNIGDSRIYILSDKEIYQISKDHNEASVQKKLNIDTNKKARLTQYLGIKKEEMVIQPFIKKIEYYNVHKVVICSDGITDMLSDKEIKNILLQSEKPENNVDSLVKRAMEHGGVDNTTVMVFNILKEDENIQVRDSKLNNIIVTVKNLFKVK